MFLDRGKYLEVRTYYIPTHEYSTRLKLTPEVVQETTLAMIGTGLMPFTKEIITVLLPIDYTGPILIVVLGLIT